MRQRIEILIMSSIDVDTWILNEPNSENELKKSITDLVTKVTGDHDTYIEVEYGEPV